MPAAILSFHPMGGFAGRALAAPAPRCPRAAAHPTRILASSDGAGANARDATRAILEAEAPFVRGVGAFEARVTYSSPLEAPWEGAGEMVSKTTQNSVIYSTVVPRELLAKAGEEGGTKVAVKRNKAFAPSPDQVMVRWEAMAGGTVVDGSSTFTLSGDGKVRMQEDTWETRPRGEEGTGANFFDAVAFARARAPGGGSSLLPSVKLAAWEALRNNPTYGGQLAREELDDFTMQMVFAVGGLGVSFLVLVGRVLLLIAEAKMS